MTREEAINILYGIKADNLNLGDLYTKSKYDALGMAIKALEQEPCEDAISRQAAIDAIWDGINMDIYTREVKECLEALPSVTPQQRWIPVSERLPEVNQRVLVTSYGRVCYAMMTSADGNSGHPVFRLQDSLNERVVCETTVHSEFTTGRIKAWMPLPEPYKAESENKG